MKLIDLPAELIAHIFTFLDDDDVFSARLSNKTLEEASLSFFGKTYFRKRGFMITTPSLKVLQSISDHEELRKYVQHVWFNPDCYTWNEPDFEDTLVQDGEHGPYSIQQQEAYAECMRDYEELLDDHEPLPSPFETIVTAVFQKLPNLITLGMRRSEQHSPYGWSILEKDIGQDPRLIGPMPPIPRGFLSIPTILFIALISAVSNTGVKLRRFYTDAVELDHIDPDYLPLEKLQHACSTILYVELNVVKARLSPSRPNGNQIRRRVLDDESQTLLFGENLVTLLNSMPQLKEVGLQILLEKSLRFAPEFRQSYPYITSMRLADEVAFPNLTRVKLERIIATSEKLQTFLRPSAANLTSLKLRDIRLLSSEKNTRPWQSFFNFLASQCPKLDYILFYHLMHDCGGVSFVEEEPEAMTEEDAEEYVVGQAVFEKYSHITLEVKGQEDVRAKLEEVAERHWYHKPLYSYAVDEELWHTDTSDEEW